MAATASARRFDELSKPKPLPPGFMEDRRSVYWVDRYPPQPGPNGTTEFATTSRQEELCKPKALPGNYRGDRPTPIWPVSNNAKSASATATICQLAEARPVHPDYAYERSPYTQVSKSAVSCEATPRLATLAEPKPCRDRQDTIPEGDFSQPITQVTEVVKSSRASARVEQLAEDKKPHPLYCGERSVQWPVSENAKNSAASFRLQQLSQPKAGQKEDYDPYHISAAAKKAVASARISELALPIPRKVRPKK